MKLILNIIAVILVSSATVFLQDICQAHETVFAFGVFGAISFFIGPYFTGSGFYARGFMVDPATPGCVWRFLGVVMWIIGGITCFVTAQAG
jgi:hypothetical protein